MHESRAARLNEFVPETCILRLGLTNEVTVRYALLYVRIELSKVRSYNLSHY